MISYRTASLLLGLCQLAACGPRADPQIAVATDPDRPWIVRARTPEDSAWLLRNDSLRHSLWYFARDDSAQLLTHDGALYVAATRQILAEARGNMGQLRAPKALCLSVGALHTLRPPPPEYLALLAADDPPYVTITACTLDPGLGVWDTVNARRAWLIWLRPGAIVREDSATVQGGYHAEFLMAAEWSCRFTRAQNSWRAAGCELEWIS